jgi:hypothetical protein
VWGVACGDNDVLCGCVVGACKVNKVRVGVSCLVYGKCGCVVSCMCVGGCVGCGVWGQ